MKKFLGLRAKTYSYLKGDNDEDKKAKGTKKCVIKRNLKFRDQKNYLKVSQIENEINYLEKKEIDGNSLKEITKYKKVMTKNKQNIKTQKIFKSQRHNVFTEEINKVALASNAYKIIQAVNSTEIYAYVTSRDLICRKKILNFIE